MHESQGMEKESFYTAAQVMIDYAEATKEGITKRIVRCHCGSVAPACNINESYFPPEESNCLYSAVVKHPSTSRASMKTPTSRRTFP